MNNEQDERNERQESNDLGTDPDVPIVHIPAPDHPHHATQKTDHSHQYIRRGIDAIRERWPTATQWTAIASLIAAGATTVYAVYAYQQWDTMRYQLRQMIRATNQTDRAIETANRSARAAEEANAQSFEHFIEDQRPYVGLDLSLTPPVGAPSLGANTGSKIDVEQDSTDPTTARLLWSIHFKNFGKSPALSVRVDKHLELGPHAFDHWHWGDVGKSSLTLNPTDDAFFTAISNKVPKTDAEQFLQADFQVVIFGHIEYTSSDGGAYWTEFCLYRLGRRIDAFCPTHNLSH